MKKMFRPSKENQIIFEKVTGRKAPFSIVIYWPWFKDHWIGFTLGCFILTKRPDDIAHICHELVHVEQFYRNPLTFWINYLLERRRVGYWHSRYEKEAYAVEEQAKQYLHTR